MSEAKPIGEIIPGIIHRCEQMMGFQKMLNELSEPTRQKQMIMAARAGGLITGSEATLLLQVYELEAA